RLTYRALHADSVRLAQGLLALGLGPGDHVAVWLPNRPEWLVVQHACAWIGAVVVALNTRYRTHELDYILRQSDAAALVLADHSGPVDFLEVLAGVLPGLRRPIPTGSRSPASRRSAESSASPRTSTAAPCATATSWRPGTIPRSRRRRASTPPGSARTTSSRSSTPRGPPRSPRAR